MNEMTYMDLVKMLFTAATSFTSILITEGIDDETAAARGAEIAADLFDRVDYEIGKLCASSEEEVVQEGEQQEDV